MLQQLLSISRNTFVEAIRQPIFVVLVLAGGVALILNPSLAAYTLEHGQGDNKMLLDLGLSTIFSIAVLLAAFTATSVLSAEIESRTVLTVVSKPVPRPVFVLGKYVGVAAAITLAYYTLCLVLFFTLRHRVLQTASDHFDGPVLLFAFFAILLAVLVAAAGNYFANWTFTSTLAGLLAGLGTLAFVLVMLVGKGWVIQSPLTDWLADDGLWVQVAIGLGMILLAVWVLTAVAVACSTRLGQVMTLLVCIGVFFLGLVSQSLDQMVDRALGLPDRVSWLGSMAALWDSSFSWPVSLVYGLIKVVYLIAPNLQFLWPADAITQGDPLSPGLLAGVATYAACYTLAVLAVAVALFQTREVG